MSIRLRVALTVITTFALALSGCGGILRDLFGTAEPRTAVNVQCPLPERASAPDAGE